MKLKQVSSMVSVVRNGLVARVVDWVGVGVDVRRPCGRKESLFVLGGWQSAWREGRGGVPTLFWRWGVSSTWWLVEAFSLGGRWCHWQKPGRLEVTAGLEENYHGALNQTWPRGTLAEAARRQPNVQLWVSGGRCSLEIELVYLSRNTYHFHLEPNTVTERSHTLF